MHKQLTALYVAGRGYDSSVLLNNHNFRVIFKLELLQLRFAAGARKDRNIIPGLFEAIGLLFKHQTARLYQIKPSVTVPKHLHPWETDGTASSLVELGKGQFFKQLLGLQGSNCASKSQEIFVQQPQKNNSLYICIYSI